MCRTDIILNGEATDKQVFEGRHQLMCRKIAMEIHAEPGLPLARDIFQPTVFIKNFIAWVVYWFNNIRTRHIGHQCLVWSTGRVVGEWMPLRKRLRLLLLFSPEFEWIGRLCLFRWYLRQEASASDKYENRPGYKKDIPGFIRQYGIDMSEFESSEPDKYQCFNDFFTRAHKPGSRPLAEPGNNSITVSAANSCLVVFDTVELAKDFWIKGRTFSVTTLMGGDEVAEEKAQRWNGGSMAVYHLSPRDYHRYHSPVAGRVAWVRHIPGEFYDVDPAVVRSKTSVLDTNARITVIITTQDFGDVLFVAIGAEEGSVKINLKENQQLKRGDEVGQFAFGGSSIVVCHEKGRRVYWVTR